MAISKRLRFRILERDSFTCQYCGRSAPSVELQVDHTVPQAYCHDDSEENLVSACVDCNLGKNDLLIARMVLRLRYLRRCDEQMLEARGTGDHAAFMAALMDRLMSKPVHLWMPKGEIEVEVGDPFFVSLAEVEQSLAYRGRVN